jgi:hypothetical protein
VAQFLKGTYRIATQSGAVIAEGLGKSEEIILDRIRNLDPGPYLVDRIVGHDLHGTLETEFWGAFRNHGGRRLTDEPNPVEG